MALAVRSSHDTWRSAPGTRERAIELTAQAYRWRHDDTRRALAFAREAQALAEALEDRPARAWALLRLAVCELILGDDPQTCESRARESLALMRELDDPAGERDALSLLANVLSTRGQSEEAIALIRTCIEISGKAGNRDGEARALNNLGALLRDLGRTGEALACLRLSLQLALTEGNHRSIAYAHVNLGAVFLALDDPSAAVEHLEQAFARVTRTDDRALECTALTHLAHARALQGASEEAQELLRHALVLARRTGNVGDLARVSLAQAAVEQGRGRHAAAEPYLHAALTALERQGDHLALADTLLRLAHSQWHLGQSSEALAAALRAESLARTAGHQALQEAAGRMRLGIARRVA